MQRRAVALLLLSAPLGACSAATTRAPVQATDAADHLEQVTRSNGNERNPAVSPDGRSLAYEASPAEGAPRHVEIVSLPRGERLYTSGEAPGTEPAWMPDGSGLVFVSKTRGAEVGLVQTVGRSPAAIGFLSDAGDPYLGGEWPSVAPDGRTLVASVSGLRAFRSGWTSSRALGHALIRTDLEGAGVTLLGEGSHPAFSPDGGRVAFERETGGHTHLFVANADGTAAAQITGGPTDDEEPSWSPDGRHLVFCSARRSGGSTEANLFALQADGSGLVQLTEGDRVACRPSWGRDGYIYFHADVGGRFHVWRLRPEGSLAR